MSVALADRGCAAVPTHVIGMGQKRRAPCDHAVNPESFGKPGLSIAWVPADPSNLNEQAELLAAQWQHALAVEIRHHAERHSSINAFAAATGQNARHLDAVLRGSSWLRLDDLGQSTVRSQDGAAG